MVCSNGQVGGYALGAEKKIELLQTEGVEVKGNRVEGMEGILYRFSSQYKNENILSLLFN